MARLPKYPDGYRLDGGAQTLPEVAELLALARALGEWGGDLVAAQQRYNTQILNDYHQRRNPIETPRVLSSQLNTTTPLYSPTPPGRIVFVSDASGGGELAYGDTSAWRLARTKGLV